MPKSKALLIYDGDCGFCKLCVDVTEGLIGQSNKENLDAKKVDFQPYQSVIQNFPDISLSEFQESIKFVDEEGKTSSAADAAFKVLAYNPLLSFLACSYDKLPGFSFVSELVYKLVATNRAFFSQLTKLFMQGNITNIFLFAMGLIYFLAYISLLSQIKGLIGENGISPAVVHLQKLNNYYGDKAFGFSPNVFWFNYSDDFMLWACMAGVVLSLVLALIRLKPDNFLLSRIFSPLILFVLYFIYNSFILVSRPFLNFQWDILLTEIGFLSIFLAIFPASTLILFLFRLLAFKLMFSSGIVKLSSGSEVWRDLTALNYHYETQPIPNPLSWYVHNLPDWFHKLSVALMFFIELLVPFMAFMSKPFRVFAFLALSSLQILIILTGNYCIFNLMTILLAYMLLKDIDLRASIDRLINFASISPLNALRNSFKYIVFLSLVSVLMIGHFFYIGRTFRKAFPALNIAGSITANFMPYNIVNGYGLFANMTTVRNEIVIQGSNDDENWLDYEFKWKPGPLDRVPSQVAPHQPRLDWQMWFAALTNYRTIPWFSNFMLRLAQGKEEVIDLLEANPFPDGPPLYMRALFYEYHFTNYEERRESGNYWKRELVSLYYPKISLKQ